MMPAMSKAGFALVLVVKPTGFTGFVCGDGVILCVFKILKIVG